MGNEQLKKWADRISEVLIGGAGLNLGFMGFTGTNYIGNWFGSAAPTVYIIIGIGAVYHLVKEGYAEMTGKK